MGPIPGVANPPLESIPSPQGGVAIAIATGVGATQRLAIGAQGVGHIDYHPIGPADGPFTGLELVPFFRDCPRVGRRVDALEVGGDHGSVRRHFTDLGSILVNLFDFESP